MCSITRKSQSLEWCLGGKLKCWESKSKVKKPSWLKRGWWYNDTDGLKTNNNRKLKFLTKIALTQDPGMLFLPQSKQLGISAVYLHMMRALGWGRANVSLLSSLRSSLWQLLTVGHREVPHLLQTSTCSSIKWELNNSHVTRSHTGTTYRASLLLLFPLQAPCPESYWGKGPGFVSPVKCFMVCIPYKHDIWKSSVFLVF